jgi:hypothetical protein
MQHMIARYATDGWMLWDAGAVLSRTGVRGVGICQMGWWVNRGILGSWWW